MDDWMDVPPGRDHSEVPSVLWHCLMGDRSGTRPVKQVSAATDSPAMCHAYPSCCTQTWIAQCDKLESVVGQTKLATLATVDV